MKYGKLWRDSAIGRWRPFYVDYKRLKKTLKVRVRDADGVVTASTRFQSVLKESIKQCSSFFVEKIEELEAILLSTGTSEETAAAGSEKEEAEEQRRVANACLEVLELRRFAFLNYLAVTKALKKRNKCFASQIAMGLVPEVTPLAVLMHQSFFSSPRLEKLVGRAEAYPGAAAELRGGDVTEETAVLASGLQATPPRPSSRLTVVLDLDQTMIFTMSKRSKLKLSEDSVSNLDSLQFWTIRMDHVPHLAKVFIRPGLEEFLRGLASLNLVVFTAGIEPYARPIIDEIEAMCGISFSQRLYRTDTTVTRQFGLVKDLSRHRFDLKRTVLLDDNPFSYLMQPLNGIPVMPFTPLVCEEEKYLVQMVLPAIKDLLLVDDVRPVLKDKYNMHGWFHKCGIEVPTYENACEETTKARASGAAPMGGLTVLQELVEQAQRKFPIHTVTKPLIRS